MISYCVFECLVQLVLQWLRFCFGEIDLFFELVNDPIEIVDFLLKQCDFLFEGDRLEVLVHEDALGCCAIDERLILLVEDHSVF